MGFKDKGIEGFGACLIINNVCTFVRPGLGNFYEI